MKVISTVSELRNQIKELKLSPIGLVPTMGALHEGHITLVRNALKESNITIVSIYVNPNQFNDKEDLKKYPRTLEADLKLLKIVLRSNDIVFTPADSEMYPVEDKRVFSFGNLDRVMEALHRPGHFNGVAQVVTRLFDIVEPDLAWFGQKDFQQVAVIKEVVRKYGYNILIRVNPTIRESDGLAMSSRNRLLDPEMRKKAPLIFKTLSDASHMLKVIDIPELKIFVKQKIEQSGDFQVEYFDISDERKLAAVTSVTEMKKNRHYFGCIAVKAGKIRLIDNIEMSVL